MSLVDPAKLTNYQRTLAELEALAIYSVMAWGRQAARAQRAVDVLLDHCPPADSPLGAIRGAVDLDMLQAAVEATRIGDYAKRRRALERLCRLDIATVDVDTLCGAVGLKSGRLVILHSRPNQPIAVLDRHVLSYMRERGYAVPEQDTPQSPRRYRQIEQWVLAECAAQGRDAAELDLSTWLERRVLPART